MPVLKPLDQLLRERPDPDLRLRPCEAVGCAKIVTQKESFSFVIIYRHVHVSGAFRSYQCPSVQHWCCSHDHAMAASHQCIDEHHNSTKLVQKPWVDGKLPEQTCAICDAALSSEAYCIAISYATPGLGYAAYSCGFEFEETADVPEVARNDPRFVPVFKRRPIEDHWCCSEEHAKAAAHACMEEHLHGGPHG